MSGRPRRGSDPWSRPGREYLAAEMSESAFDRAIVALAKGYGIKLRYHTHRSDKSEKGFPDRVFVGTHGALFRELKTETGVVTPEQQEWLDGMRAVGLDADVWRPRDLFSGRIDRELRAIAGIRMTSPPASRPPRPPGCSCLVTVIMAGECTHRQQPDQ